MRIGILGGSFNPIHNGHLLMAEVAKEEMRLDKVVFVPAFCSPHKEKSDSSLPKDRAAMVKLAIKGNPAFEVDLCEIKRGGVSFTVDTLTYFRGKYKNATLFWIVGSDSLRTLHTWRDIPRILTMASFVAVNRPGYQGSSKVRITPIEMPGVDISSSDIRRRIKSKKSIRYIIPDVVIGYIKRRGLYQ